MTPAELHAQDADRFTHLVESTTDWDRPSPVAEWTARGVVEHLLGWLPEFLERTGSVLPPVDAADLPNAWRQRVSAVQHLIETEGEREFTSPMFGTMTIGAAINQFYTADIWMHSWDLAKAIGVDIDLGEQRCTDAYQGMQPMDSVLRDSGQFGPRIDVPAGASAQDRLIGFIGRDPYWTPPLR